MGKNIFDLRQFREDHLHLTQKELAELLDIRQDSVSRMEQNPDQMTITTLVKLAKLSGQSLDDVLNYRPIQPQGLEVKRTWDAVKYSTADTRAILKGYHGPDGLSDPVLKDVVDKLDQLLDILSRKPVLAVAGSASSGKSTFINSLLGQSLLPVNAWQRISRRVRIRHTEDRPKGLEKSVYLIRNAGGTPVWDVEKLDGDKYREKWVLMSGGLDLLSSGGDDPEVGEILVYVDSSILLNCDIIRLPYPNFSDKPDDPTLINISSDLLVYLVPGTNGVQSETASYFRILLEQMPVLERADCSKPGCLSNLFIVCSKAHLLGDEGDARHIAQMIGSVLYDTLPPSFWDKREQITGISYGKKDFLSRCFFYAVYDDPKWRTDLETALCASIEQMPGVIREDISRNARAYRDTVCQELAARTVRQVPVQPEESFPWASMSSPERKAAALQQQYRVKDNIARCKLNSVEAFRQYCAHDLFKQMPSYGSKDQLQQQVTSLQTEMEQELEQILRKEQETFLKGVEEYLSFFNGPVDTRNIFEKSLQKATSPGALVRYHPRQNNSVWEASIQSFLSASFANSPVSTSTLFAGGITGAAIGSVIAAAALPIIPIVTGALAAISSVSGIMSAASKTTSSKKIAKSVQTIFSDEIVPSYEECIRRFWDDTQSTFDAAAKDLQDKWLDTLNAAGGGIPQETVSLEQNRKDTLALKDFLGSLPL